jgi:hypothetical protein
LFIQQISDWKTHHGNLLVILNILPEIFRSAFALRKSFIHLPT